MEDQLYEDIVNYLTDDILPQTYKSNKRNFIALANKCEVIQNGVLLRDEKPIITQSMQSSVFTEFHGKGHCGRDACWAKIKKR